LLIGRPSRGGTLKLTIISYGNIERCATDIVDRLVVGGLQWTVRGLWRQAGSHCVFVRAE
jgi:hypothetical protein